MSRMVACRKEEGFTGERNRSQSQRSGKRQRCRIHAGGDGVIHVFKPLVAFSIVAEHGPHAVSTCWVELVILDFKWFLLAPK